MENFNLRSYLRAKGFIERERVNSKLPFIDIEQFFGHPSGYTVNITYKDKINGEIEYILLHEYTKGSREFLLTKTQEFNKIKNSIVKEYFGDKFLINLNVFAFGHINSNSKLDSIEECNNEFKRIGWFI